jgi:hypothetical protein
MRDHETFVFHKHLLSQKGFHDQKSIGNTALMFTVEGEDRQTNADH